MNRQTFHIKLNNEEIDYAEAETKVKEEELSPKETQVESNKQPWRVNKDWLIRRGDIYVKKELTKISYIPDKLGEKNPVGLKLIQF